MCWALQHIARGRLKQKNDSNHEYKIAEIANIIGELQLRDERARETWKVKQKIKINDDMRLKARNKRKMGK